MREPTFCLLALATVSLAFPANNQPGSLPDLIKNVFGPGGSTAAPGVGTVGTTPDEFDKLVRETFTTSPPRTILGTDNTTPKQENCECVPYYQCRDGEITETGIGLIDVRLNQCGRYLDVCCKPPSIKEPEKKPPVVVPKQSLGCGRRNVGGVAFRITGQRPNEAQFGEFPWMVAILKEERINDNRLNVYQCGGALIHPQAVLTAAHCVSGKPPAELKVRAGEWDTQTKNETYAHQDRNVREVIIHEGFDSGTLHNDFAILILTEPVTYEENVDIVCLPDANTNLGEGSGCLASGWGKDLFGNQGHYQVILKRVELPLVASPKCEALFRTTRLGKYFRLHESFICAGGLAGRDTCTGDGGSPLVCPLPNDPTRYVQAGIVAWGIGCGQDQIPGAYSNIAYARKWIDERMAEKNLDTSVYQYRP